MDVDSAEADDEDGGSYHFLSGSDEDGMSEIDMDSDVDMGGDAAAEPSGAEESEVEGIADITYEDDLDIAIDRLSLHYSSDDDDGIPNKHLSSEQSNPLKRRRTHGSRPGSEDGTGGEEEDELHERTPSKRLRRATGERVWTGDAEEDETQTAPAQARQRSRARTVVETDSEEESEDEQTSRGRDHDYIQLCAGEWFSSYLSTGGGRR